MEKQEEGHIVRILRIDDVTHDVRRFTLNKPDNYRFEPGQATEIAINKDGWKTERRPFTFTCLNDWDTLEFTIKIYPDHQGVTDQLGKLKEGDELILHDVWGAIQYKGEGTFIAGGAGITPIIAIFRQLEKEGRLGNSRLIFSNKTVNDIILREEFEKMLGKNFFNILSKEKNSSYNHGIIDEAFLKKNIENTDQYFYICGPDPMIDSIASSLEEMGVRKEKIVREEF